MEVGLRLLQKCIRAGELQTDCERIGANAQATQAKALERVERESINLENGQLRLN